MVLIKKRKGSQLGQQLARASQRSASRPAQQHPHPSLFVFSLPLTASAHLSSSPSCRVLPGHRADPVLRPNSIEPRPLVNTNLHIKFPHVLLVQFFFAKIMASRARFASPRSRWSSPPSEASAGRLHGL